MNTESVLGGDAVNLVNAQLVEFIRMDFLLWAVYFVCDKENRFFNS